MGHGKKGKVFGALIKDRGYFFLRKIYPKNFRIIYNLFFESKLKNKSKSSKFLDTGYKMEYWYKLKS